MYKVFMPAAVFSLFVLSGFSQHAQKSASDTIKAKGSHQIKTVNTQVIKIDNADQQNKQPLPPMKTRQDTLRYLIQQHKQKQQKLK